MSALCFRLSFYTSFRVAGASQATACSGRMRETGPIRCQVQLARKVTLCLILLLRLSRFCPRLWLMLTVKRPRLAKSSWPVAERERGEKTEKQRAKNSKTNAEWFIRSIGIEHCRTVEQAVVSSSEEAVVTYWQLDGALAIICGALALWPRRTA